MSNYITNSENNSNELNSNELNSNEINIKSNFTSIKRRINNELSILINIKLIKINIYNTNLLII
jgi:hypothetical protein